jgi:hypothetical protein
MSMNNNPSPGNKAGGLTTILEKSLGAAAKGGTKTLAAVYHYAEPVKSKGFVYMDTPGYDPVAATGQVAGGALDVGDDLVALGRDDRREDLGDEGLHDRAVVGHERRRDPDPGGDGAHRERLESALAGERDGTVEDRALALLGREPARCGGS